MPFVTVQLNQYKEGPLTAESRFAEEDDFLTIHWHKLDGSLVIPNWPVDELFALGEAICAHAQEKAAREAIAKNEAEYAELEENTDGR